jgi:methanogenic corrinoid protein MtbC1
VTEKSAGADHSRGNAARPEAGRLSRLYLDALRAADAAGAYRVVMQALEQGMTMPALYSRVVAPAMHEIGALWEKGAITVADEHAATALTHRVLAGLRAPVSVEVAGDAGREGKSPLALLAAVEGEQHALGLRMAADVLEDSGYRVVYLGADVPTDALLQSVTAFSPDLLALSATMPELSPVLEGIVLSVRDEHPEIGLLLGGQASLESQGGIQIRDIESLPEKVAQPI